MNDRIAIFLRKQTCVSICCINERGYPYCFTCFYVINSDNGLLYFKSSPEAYHSKLLASNPVVAGTILPDNSSKIAMKGVQLIGELLKQDDVLSRDAYLLYYKRYPFALAIKGEVFTIRVDSIKMTNSSKIFGEKIIWKRSELDKDTTALKSE